MNKPLEHSIWLLNLHKLYGLTEKAHQISIEEIVQIFSGKGIYFLLLLLSLPFCIPLPIPGVSTPFGIVIVFLSLRVLFRRHVYYPKWIREKKISASSVRKIAAKMEKVFMWLERFSHPRWVFLIDRLGMNIVHAIFFLSSGLFLALPLPIPMTNVLAAWPMALVAFGILQEDGLIVAVGYMLLTGALLGIIHFLV